MRRPSTLTPSIFTPSTFTPSTFTPCILLALLISYPVIASASPLNLPESSLNLPESSLNLPESSLNLLEMDVHIFSLRSRRQSKAWGGARRRGTPGMTSDLSHQPAKRAAAIDVASMIMKERITKGCRPLRGLDGIGYAEFLGFRAAALHPRLYSGARVRGLGFDIRTSDLSNFPNAVEWIQELNLLRALSGQWAGTVAAGSMSGSLEIALSQESGVWAASVKMDMGGRQALNQAGDLKVSETELSFTMGFAGANLRFAGKVGGEIISGALEATAGGRVVGSGSWKVRRISTPQPTPDKTTTAASTNSGQARVIGEVMDIDRNALRLSIRLDSGETVTVKPDLATSYLRVSPDESSLEKAAPISLAEIAVGDRVYARGQKAEDKTAFSARQLIVMTRADLAQKRERERMAWRQRSVVGAITALNPNSREISLLMRTPDGARPLTMKIGEGVRFRRYAPDSVKFSDTRPSSFSELRVDDQLRALGEKSADGSRFTPEEIVSGSFRIIGGVVAAINRQSNEITINEMQTQQAVTVVISKDSLLRQLAPEFAATLANRARRGNAPAAKSSSNTPDPEEAVERMPAFTISELKPGDRVIVTCVRNEASPRVTAVGLFTGVDPLFKLLQEQLARQRGGAASNLSLGLPMGVL